MKPLPVVFCPRSLLTTDMVAEEAPLAIDIVYGKAHHRKSSRLTVTMRSPGHDEELTLGLLFSLGIIDHPRDVVSIAPCLRSKLEPTEITTITVELATERDYQPLDFLAGHARFSGCGVCGSTELPDAAASHTRNVVIVDASCLRDSSEKMAHAQRVFQETGGSHAAALFTDEGALIALFEDVGRHNALDKLIGYCLTKPETMRANFLVMSSRAGFEIVQKAARAGLTLVAVMGAVSSMAVEIAQKHGVTLVGFLRSDRLNVYTHPERIRGL